MNSLRISIASLTLLASVSFGQAPDTLWTRTYGTPMTDECYSLCITSDSSVVVTGRSDGFGPSNWDFLTIKTNLYGDSLWARTTSSFQHEIAEDVCETSDSALVVVGWQYNSSGPAGWNIGLRKYSLQGDTMWSRTVGDNQDQFAYAVVAGDTGSVVVTGYTMYAGYLPEWVLGFDSNGNNLWTRVLFTSELTVGVDICQVSSSRYAIAGNARTWYGTDMDGYATLITGAGDTLWTRRLGGSSDDAFTAVTSMRDSSMIYVGTTSSNGNGLQVWIVRFSIQGDIVWERAFDVPNLASIKSVTASMDDGIVIAGNAERNFGNRDGFLLKTNDNGDSLWTAWVDYSSGDNISDVIQTPNAEFLACGYTFSNSNNSKDYWLIAFGADTFVITTPNNEEELSVFSTETVRWTGGTLGGTVSIELNRHYPIGGWEVITESTDNDGVFEWFVTDPLSDSCRIRICALPDTFCDVSDGNFSIVSSQGYLGLVRSNQLNSPVLSWPAGSVECPDDASEWFRFKNFGSEPIVVFQPQELPSNEFSITITCGSFFALSPGGISACSLSVSFAPTEVGSFFDTLRIQTDAVNGVNGYVDIPLSGSQIRTPESPEVVLSTVGNNSVLRWGPVTQSIGHCDIDPPVYLVFFSEDPDGPFWFHGLTTDTSYIHVGAVQYASEMFYHVYAAQNQPATLSVLTENAKETMYSEMDFLRAISFDRAKTCSQR